MNRSPGVAAPCALVARVRTGCDVEGMKRILRTLLAVGGVLLFLAVGLLVLSESGEVVVLRTSGPDGAKESRLWIVDGPAGPIVRGSNGKTWVENARANREVALWRSGEWRTRAAVELDGDAVRTEANPRMRTKYGVADDIIGLFDDFDAAVAFVLVAPDAPVAAGDL